MTGSFAEADIEVVWPDLSDPLADYPSALEQALNIPVGAPRLEEQVSAGSSVAIVVDDPSRWTPVREALPIVLTTATCRGGSPRRCDDQRRGWPPSRRRCRGDATAAR